MADNQKKDGFFKKIASNAKATKSEFKKVSWPTRKQLINNTWIVIVCIVIVGIVIFALDTLFGFGFKFLNEQKIDVPTEISTEFSTEVATEIATELGTEVAPTEVATIAE